MIEFERYLSKFKPIRTYNGINLYITSNQWINYDGRPLPELTVLSNCPYCGSRHIGIVQVDPNISGGWFWVEFGCGVVIALGIDCCFGISEPSPMCRLIADRPDDVI